MNAELSSKIRELMKTRGIPGVAVGVYNNGEVTTQGYGITNVDHPLPVDDDTLFQIGSITKTFVGTMTMMLVEMGKLDLDTSVKTYLPDFKVQDKEASEKATIRHLYTHTAGWVGDWFPSGIEQGPDSVEHYVKTMVDDPQFTPLGQYLSYNNAGYNLAGRILEAVTGKVFSDLVKEMIIEPLGMEDTYILPWEMMTKRYASGHSPGEKRVEVIDPWFIGRASGPAGGIVSSVKDMVKYIKLHLCERSDLISKESLAALHTPQLEYAPGRNIALTFWVDDHRSARSMGHSGGTVGQQALLTIVPEHDFGVMIGTNCATGAVAKYQMADVAIKVYLGVETHEPEIMKMAKEGLHEYVGEYEAKLSAVKIEAGDGELLFRSKYLGGFPTSDDIPEVSEYGDPARFGFYDKDHIKGLDKTNNTSIAQFIREHGKVTMVRSGMRLHKRL
jgi:CubicO group peptidase (beta-lactamase class C family)